MKHLYFCRHGESELNVQGRWSGRTETPLTEEGRAQAKLEGKAARELGVDYIICSPLSRARDTAHIIAEEIGHPIHEIEINSLIVERNFGPLEGQPYRRDLNLDSMDDVEKIDTLVERARLTLQYLKTIEADIVLVVSHGAFGRALRHILHPSIPVYGEGSEKFQNAKLYKLI